MTDLPFLSVIIPTYNRAQMLGDTVNSFKRQDYPVDRVEIIIADNNSNDGTRGIVDGLLKRSHNIRYVFEPRQGVHFARNSAAKVSCGEILYFTDDDMVADPCLLQEIVKPFFLDKKVACATGKVLPIWEQPPPRWVLELCVNSFLSLHEKLEDLVIAACDCGVYSCHQAIRRDVFFRSGGFNPENTAGVWVGDGETGLNIKIMDLGYKFAYTGHSVIYHRIPPSRMTQAYLNKRLANQGNCDSYTDYKKHKYSNYKLYGRICCYLWQIVMHSAYTLKNIFLANLVWRLRLAYIWYYFSRVLYDYRLTHDKAWRELVLKNNWLEE